jgi:hypothetical protein
MGDPFKAGEYLSSGLYKMDDKADSEDSKLSAKRVRHNAIS